MTEAEWLACDEPERMLEFVRGRVSDRKLRLFAVACFRQVWSDVRGENERALVLTAERYADGQETRDGLYGAYYEVFDGCEPRVLPCGEDDAFRMRKHDVAGTAGLRPSGEPAGGVLQDLQDGAFLVDGEGLVAGPEVEDPALAHPPDGGEEALGVAAGALVHGLHERRRPVRRVQGEQRQFAGLDAVGDLDAGALVDVLVAQVAPPHQDVAGVEDAAAEALLGVVEAHRLDGKAGSGAQVGGDPVADEVVVRLLLGRLLL